jgi:hypothetical protein
MYGESDEGFSTLPGRDDPWEEHHNRNQQKTKNEPDDFDFSEEPSISLPEKMVKASGLTPAVSYTGRRANRINPTSGGLTGSRERFNYANEPGIHLSDLLETLWTESITISAVPLDNTIPRKESSSASNIWDSINDNGVSSEPKVEQLVAMGFNPERATQALKV